MQFYGHLTPPSPCLNHDRFVLTSKCQRFPRAKYIDAIFRASKSAAVNLPAEEMEVS
jgi:hypothetical protein